MNDYEQMTSVIEYLVGHAMSQPDLAELAAVADLSPAHLQRKFAKWVGVSPKTFLQCLTLTRVQEILANGKSVLDASLAGGLSGPGRLHDLCIKLESASPGELKSGGHGLDIHYGFGCSPFGKCIIAWCHRGICYLAFTGEETREQSLQGLKNTWPGADLYEEKTTHLEWLQKVFMPGTDNAGAPLRAYVNGTCFQVRVWRALLEIPPGMTASYGELARTIGRPAAARAAGSAVAANALAYLVPCHRIIRNTGITGNYRWGTERKRQMLAFETARLCSAEQSP